MHCVHVQVAAAPVVTWGLETSRELSQLTQEAASRLDATVTQSIKALQTQSGQALERVQAATADVEAASGQLDAALASAVAGAKAALGADWTSRLESSQRAAAQLDERWRAAASQLEAAVGAAGRSLAAGGGSSDGWVQRLPDNNQQAAVPEALRQVAEQLEGAAADVFQAVEAANLPQLAVQLGETLLSVARQAVAPFDVFGDWALNSLFVAVIILLTTALLVAAPRQ